MSPVIGSPQLLENIMAKTLSCLPIFLLHPFTYCICMFWSKQALRSGMLTGLKQLDHSHTWLLYYMGKCQARLKAVNTPWTGRQSFARDTET